MAGGPLPPASKPVTMHLALCPPLPSTFKEPHDDIWALSQGPQYLIRFATPLLPRKVTHSQFLGMTTRTYLGDHYSAQAFYLPSRHGVVPAFHTAVGSGPLRPLRGSAASLIPPPSGSFYKAVISPSGERGDTIPLDLPSLVRLCLIFLL